MLGFVSQAAILYFMLFHHHPNKTGPMHPGISILKVKAMNRIKKNQYILNPHKKKCTKSTPCTGQKLTSFGVIFSFLQFFAANIGSFLQCLTLEIFPPQRCVQLFGPVFRDALSICKCLTLIFLLFTCCVPQMLDFFQENFQQKLV